jgi:allantoicase
MLLMERFGQPMDFTCVETQIGNGEKADCEILDLDSVIMLQLPSVESESKVDFLD